MLNPWILAHLILQRNQGKIDSGRRDPELPAVHNGRRQVTLDLVGQRAQLPGESQVPGEHTGQHNRPQCQLICSHLVATIGGGESQLASGACGHHTSTGGAGNQLIMEDI